MGDRSNVFFRSGKDGIGVYAHWSGESMADAVMRVLKSKAFTARLGDANYAMRVGVQLVLEILGADSKSDTGFGLWTASAGPDDNEYRWVVIDVDSGELFVAKNWKKPTPSERIARPTVSEIRRRMRPPEVDAGRAPASDSEQGMRGEPPVSSKKKKAPSRGSAKTKLRSSSRR